MVGADTGEAGPVPQVFQSRQRTEPFTISQTLLGIAGVATSNRLACDGYDSVQVHVRADRTFTVRVFESIDGVNWSLADVIPSAADPFTPADQLVLISVGIESLFCRVTVTNTSGGALTVFQASAYLIPVGGAGGGGGGSGPLGPYAQGDFDSINVDERTATAMWVRSAITGRDQTQAAGSQNTPVEARAVVNFAGDSTSLISLLTQAVQTGIDTTGAAVLRPTEARVPSGFDGLVANGFFASYTVANLFGRDTTGAAVVRPVEARTVSGYNGSLALNGLLAASFVYALDVGSATLNYVGSSQITDSTANVAAPYSLDVRESGYVDMVRGRRFSFTHQTPGTLVTAQAAFVATTPTLLLYNSAGNTSVVGLRTQRIDITSATTAPVFVTIMLDTADRFSAGGTAVVGQNWNEASATAYPGTSFKFNATATAAGGGTRYLGTFAIPAGAGQSLTFNSKDGIQVTGVGSIGVYVYDSAATTAPTCLFTTEVFAY